MRIFWSARRWFVVCVLSLTATSCLPLPAVLPPVHLSAGPQVLVGDVVVAEDGRLLSRAEAGLGMSAGVAPLTLFEGQRHRVWEPTVGYTAFWFFNQNLRRRDRHGALLGLSAFLGAFELGSGLWLRLRAHLQGAYLAQVGLAGDGAGGHLELGAELISPDFRDRPERGSVAWVGHRAGEWGVGLSMQAGYARGSFGEYGLSGFALTVRAPGLFGAVLVPLSDPANYLGAEPASEAAR